MASPFPDRNTRVLAVGATGADGQAQIAGMRAAGTQIVATVAIGRAGQATGRHPGLRLGRRGRSPRPGPKPPPSTRRPPASATPWWSAPRPGIRFAVAAAEFVPLHDTLYACAFARQTGTCGWSAPTRSA